VLFPDHCPDAPNHFFAPPRRNDSRPPSPSR
jgi:hypothetical protein